MVPKGLSDAKPVMSELYVYLDAEELAKLPWRLEGILMAAFDSYLPGMLFHTLPGMIRTGSPCSSKFTIHTMRLDALCL